MNDSNSNKPSQGAIANKQGRILENTIIPTFTARGFEVISYSKWRKKPEKYSKELLLTNAPYKSIYGHNGKTEFLVKSQKLNLNVRIECKWQQSSGSVDEKYPYLYLNCIEAMPEKEIIIVHGGGGMKAGALLWLKESVKQKKFQNPSQTKNIQVFTLEEFLMWANKVLR